MVARGLSNGEIAEQLTISPATAKTHVAHLLTKLDARDRIQLVIIAYQSGLCDPGGRPPWNPPHTRCGTRRSIARSGGRRPREPRDQWE